MDEHRARRGQRAGERRAQRCPNPECVEVAEPAELPRRQAACEQGEAASEGHERRADEGQERLGRAHREQKDQDTRPPREESRCLKGRIQREPLAAQQQRQGEDRAVADDSVAAPGTGPAQRGRPALHASRHQTDDAPEDESDGGVSQGLVSRRQRASGAIDDRHHDGAAESERQGDGVPSGGKPVEAAPEERQQGENQEGRRGQERGEAPRLDGAGDEAGRRQSDQQKADQRGRSEARERREATCQPLGLADVGLADRGRALCRRATHRGDGRHRGETEEHGGDGRSRLRTPGEETRDEDQHDDGAGGVDRGATAHPGDQRSGAREQAPSRRIRVEVTHDGDEPRQRREREGDGLRTLRPPAQGGQSEGKGQVRPRQPGERLERGLGTRVQTAQGAGQSSPKEHESQRIGCLTAPPGGVGQSREGQRDEERRRHQRKGGGVHRQRGPCEQPRGEARQRDQPDRAARDGRTQPQDPDGHQARGQRPHRVRGRKESTLHRGQSRGGQADGQVPGARSITRGVGKNERGEQRGEQRQQRRPRERRGDECAPGAPQKHQGEPHDADHTRPPPPPQPVRGGGQGAAAGHGEKREGAAAREPDARESPLTEKGDEERYGQQCQRGNQPNPGARHEGRNPGADRPESSRGQQRGHNSRQRRLGRGQCHPERHEHRQTQRPGGGVVEPPGGPTQRRGAERQHAAARDDPHERRRVRQGEGRSQRHRQESQRHPGQDAPGLDGPAPGQPTQRQEEQMVDTDGAGDEERLEGTLECAPRLADTEDGPSEDQRPAQEPPQISSEQSGQAAPSASVRVEGAHGPQMVHRALGQRLARRGRRERRNHLARGGRRERRNHLDRGGGLGVRGGPLDRLGGAGPLDRLRLRHGWLDLTSQSGGPRHRLRR